MRVAKFRIIQTVCFIILLAALALALTANADCGLRSKNKLVKLPMPVTPPLILGSLK